MLLVVHANSSASGAAAPGISSDVSRWFEYYYNRCYSPRLHRRHMTITLQLSLQRASMPQYAEAPNSPKGVLYIHGYWRFVSYVFAHLSL